ncbi:MAG: hypothetical protein ABI954_08290 [Pyrinomonadaceae bacterium]
MSAKLTVTILIFLFLEAGIALILLPWFSPFGVNDWWGENYLLVYASTKTGLPILRQAVASGWVRGAVTALGVLNLAIAFWEIANFNRAVRQLEGGDKQSDGDNDFSR